jgi:hypothetical protein
VAKIQKKKEMEMHWKEKEAEQDQQHQAWDPDALFMGSLTSKNKLHLQEIAAALNLAEDGTKGALIQCFLLPILSFMMDQGSPGYSIMLLDNTPWQLKAYTLQL